MVNPYLIAPLYVGVAIAAFALGGFFAFGGVAMLVCAVLEIITHRPRE